MSALAFILIIGFYFSILLGISWYTSRNADNDAYFLGNKKSPWYAVAFGMIGDSLSGVTFISVPGAVGLQKFGYFQLVLGYFFGYMVITSVLLPLYYRMNLTSIYSYLRDRFGENAEKTGSFFFILSRTLGAAGRLYLAAGVIQIFIFDALGIPFWLSVTGIIVLILLYTLKGGIRTLVWTDTFQSFFLLAGVVFSISAIMHSLGWGPAEMMRRVSESDYIQIGFWDWRPKSFFPKQFFGGMFIAIAMTGLDQNMMQKNLSLRTLGEAQKNIRWFSIVLIFVNLFFLCLGALLYLYAKESGIALPAKSDDLFPMLALNHLGTFAAVVFILGLTAATFSSADSVLTTLTTSLYFDFLKADTKADVQNTRLRNAIHLGFAAALLGVILIFRILNDKAVIDTILMIAGYTYGPLLGLFTFGIFFRKRPDDRLIPWVCLISPVLCWLVSSVSKTWLGGYEFGNEILILNGLITFTGLSLLPASAPEDEKAGFQG